MRGRDAQKGKANRLTSNGRKIGDKSFSCPPLYTMFQSSGYLAPSPFVENRDTIIVFAELAINATREDQVATDVPPTVYSCTPNFELNNWKAVEIPIVYKLSE